MRLSPLRLVHLALLLVMHVSLAGLALFALGAAGEGAEQPARWPQLTAAMLLALLLDRSLRHLPQGWRSRAWSICGLLVIALLLKSLVGGGISPLSGWSSLAADDYGTYQELIFSSIALLYLWWRGSRLSELDYDDISTLFRRGFIGLLLALPFLQWMMQAPLNRPELVAVLIAYVVVFVFSSLLGLAITNMRGRESGSRRRWIITTVLPVLALILLSLAAVSSLSAPLRRLLSQALEVLLVTVYWIFSPLIALFAVLGAWIMSGIATNSDRPQPTATPQATPLAQPDLLSQLREEAPPPPAWADDLWRVIGLLILIAAMILALRWMLRQSRKTSDEMSEERDSLWSWSEIAGDLRGALRSLLAALHRQPHGLRAALAALGARDPVTRIRRAYIRLLLLGEEQEQPRRPEQTPREYRGQAQGLAPRAAEAVDLLTAAYEEARYGPAPSAERAAAAEQALTTIRQQVERSEQAP